jgi:hypothetical protein
MESRCEVGQLRRWQYEFDKSFFIVLAKLPGQPGKAGTRWSILIEGKMEWFFEENIIEDSEVVIETR